MERLNGYIGVNNNDNNNKESEGNVNFNYNNFISTHKKPPKQYITNPMLNNSNNNNNHLAITSTKYIKHHNAVKPHPTFIQLNNTSPTTPKILYKREEIKTNTNPSSHSNNNNNSRQLRSSSSDKSSSFSFTNIHKHPPHYRQFSLLNKETPNNNNNNPIPSSSNPKFSLNNVTYFSRSSTNDKSLPSNHSFTSLNFKQSTSKNEFIKRAIKTASRKPHSNSLNYKHANFLDISNSNTSMNHSLLNDIKYQQYNNFIISDSNSAKNLCKLI
jgi:hypothetical protein